MSEYKQLYVHGYDERNEYAKRWEEEVVVLARILRDTLDEGLGDGLELPWIRGLYDNLDDLTQADFNYEW